MAEALDRPAKPRTHPSHRRSSLNLIVRASEVATGIAEPPPDQLAVLLAEAVRPAVVNGWESSG